MTLISQSSSTDIIRASDLVLPTAVTRTLGNLAKENIFSALSNQNKNGWLTKEEVAKLGEIIAEASETSEGLEILRVTLEGNLMHMKSEDILSSSATNESLDKQEQDLVLKTLKRAHRRGRIGKKELQISLQVVINAMTKAEVLAIMVSVIRGDDEIAILASAEKAETEVMSVTHAMRASRHDTRGDDNQSFR